MEQRSRTPLYNRGVSTPRTRVEVIFHGRVQGVGFRATVAGLARDLPVTGWVRNEPDGSVRMEAQGDRDQVERLLALIHSRMGHFITGSTAHDRPLRDAEPAFRITH